MVLLVNITANWGEVGVLNVQTARLLSTPL